jgi:hypothetical protein
MMIPIHRTTLRQWMGMSDETRLFMFNLTEWQCSQANPDDKRQWTPLIKWALWDEQKKWEMFQAEEAELMRRIEAHNERENPTTVRAE